MKKLLFIDTEFTDLVPDNKLISIALVTEDGNSFYAELTDTYKESDCSEFAKVHVLPFLKGEPFKMTEIECSLKIANWIEDLGEQYLLACDNESWDRPHLVRLIGMTGLWPANLDKKNYFRFIIMDDIAAKIVNEHKLDVHNALDDAMGMMYAFNMKEVWGY